MFGRRRNEHTDFEVRGVKSVLISRALQFLDMIQQGYADFGKIENTKAPEEFTEFGTIAYGSALVVLGKFDPELKKSFSSIVREKLSPEVSAWTKWFVRITLSGSLLGLPVLIILEVLRMIGIVPTEIALPMMLIGFAIVVVLVCLITIYAYREHGKDPPQNILYALQEPELRFEAERAFERIIEIFQEESNQSLRTLVVGEYDIFDYTESSFTTSRDLNLRLAILNPRPRVSQ